MTEVVDSTLKLSESFPVIAILFLFSVMFFFGFMKFWSYWQTVKEKDQKALVDGLGRNITDKIDSIKPDLVLVVQSEVKVTGQSVEQMAGALEKLNRAVMVSQQLHLLNIKSDDLPKDIDLKLDQIMKVLDEWAK